MNKKKRTQSQPTPAPTETQPAKPTNGHLTLKESKRTIVLTWGKYSITAVCLTATLIALIQKVRF